MEKCNKIKSEIYKYLVQHIVHQKVQQKVLNNYAVHLIKWFVFTRLVKCLS